MAKSYILSPRTGTVTRWTPTTIDADGEIVDAVESTFTVEGSFQPLPGVEVEIDVGGVNRVVGVWVGYMDDNQAELNTFQLDPERRADQIAVDGRIFIVIKKADWRFDGTGNPHIQYELAELGQDEGG